MSFGKDIFCHGIEPYNFRDTDETVATITANVGQSTAIGPKVAIRRNKPFPPLGEVVAIDMGAGKSSSNFNRNLSPTITCTHGGEPVIGTIDASIYRKNSNQDNSKYIIKTHRKNKMDNKNIDLLMKASKDGVDVVGLMGSLEANLKLVKDGVLSIDEAITACEDLRNTLGKKAGKEAKERIESGIEKVKEMAKEYESMKEAIKDINNDAPHQQDQLNCQDDAARTLAAGTHGAASHLTKTCVEGEDDDGEEMCVVRRLTPTETARLQGFPDDYTKIDGPETADAPQFKAHGNSWATPCANFMNTRIEMELRRLGHEGTIRYATCCSGVEAHSVSVRDLDWKSVFFSEIEPFPCRLLEKHYPDTPNLGDMTQIHYDEKAGAISNAHKDGEEYSLPSCFKEAPIRELPFKVGDLEVFSGGTPCQSVSVAGKREGMAENSGTRSSLAFHYQRIIDETRPVFTLWENVCFGADTLVTTDEGHKKISEVKVGDKVRSFDGKCHRVERVMETKGKETIKLSVMGAEEIEVTPNHPFYARKKLNNTGDTSKVEFSKPEWVAAGELTQDHYICYKVDDGQNVIDQEKAYSCGRDLAEHNFDARPFFEESIFDLSLDTKKEILRGYFNARWNLDEHNVMSFKTQSHEFALCIARLVRDVYHRGVEIKESRDSWDCSFANGDGFEEDGFVWCPVKKVSPGVKQTVYNLTVADTHTYEANDVVVHNCGVFSSNGGADFIWFVNRCAESGYSLAWRVLDAQYTMTEEFPRAVPQRRRRVWLVGYRGNDWRIPARIVFELDKKLTANPPDRVPGKGFKTLNKDFVADGNSTATAKPKEEEQSLFLVSLGTDDGSDELLKVSKMIDFSDMPDESDFSKVSMADIFSFVKKVGVPGYVGPVFRTDKKKSKKAKKDEPVFDLFNLDAAKPTEAVSTEADESENEEWVGAEKITPAIIENIGNAGIMANGRIATISCHEWTSGIQLSPKTQAAWDELVKNKEWLKANELLPEAYDETVCGLSDVLQEDPDEKYNLSWRASFGILKRAKTRGKELPAALGIALVSTIRENAGIVKWAALNGKDTKKNESDLSERENAMLCFNEYIAPVAKFEDVEAVQPKRKNDGESDIEEDVDEADVEVDEDGNPITKDDDFPFGDDCETTGKETSTEVDKPAMPDLANGVINVSGGETAATLLASGDAAVGTTQDANIIALKKEGRFQEDA